MPPHPTSWRSVLILSSSHLRLGLPSGFYPSGFRNKTLYTPLLSPIRDKWGPCHHIWRVLRMWMKERPPIWRVAANILNKQSRTADMGCSSSLGVGRGANTSSLKKTYVTKWSHRKPRTCTDTAVRHTHVEIVISISKKCCQIYRCLSQPDENY